MTASPPSSEVVSAFSPTTNEKADLPVAKCSVLALMDKVIIRARAMAAAHALFSHKAVILYGDAFQKFEAYLTDNEGRLGFKIWQTRIPLAAFSIAPSRTQNLPVNLSDSTV